MRAVDIWGIIWIFILLCVFYAVVNYDVVIEKIKSWLKKLAEEKITSSLFLGC